MCLSVALIVHLNATEELLQWPVLCIELHVPSLFQGCLFFSYFLWLDAFHSGAL